MTKRNLLRDLDQKTVMRLFRELGVDPAANCPHPLLAQDSLEFRHMDRPILHDALADPLDENLVAFRTGQRVAQIGSKAPRKGLDSMAASAILGVPGFTDLDGQRIAPIRILGEPFLAERW